MEEANERRREGGGSPTHHRKTKTENQNKTKYKPKMKLKKIKKTGKSSGVVAYVRLHEGRLCDHKTVPRFGKGSLFGWDHSHSRGNDMKIYYRVALV